jgi:hypothetical protein
VSKYKSVDAKCRKRLGEEHYAKDGLSEFSKAARQKKSLIYRIALTVSMRMIAENKDT